MPTTRFRAPPRPLAPFAGALCLLSAALTVSAGGQAYASGEEVIRAMQGRYAGKWYRTLTFVQQSTFGNGTVQTWYEAMAIPGKLRIDIAPVDSGNGNIFRNDSVYVLRGREVRQSRPQVHPLLLLGFDVYHLPVEKTVGALRQLGIDLNVVHEDTWQGRPAIVVGAARGDTTSYQFWIDKERLVFTRLRQPMPNGTLTETQFNKYAPLAGGWIAPEVLFYQNGRLALTEEYRDMQTGMTFDADLFTPAPWKAPGWVGR